MLLKYLHGKEPVEKLSPSALKTSAEKATGLTDYGEDTARFEEGLAVLCDSMNNESSLSFAGSFMAKEQLELSIRNRLLLVDYIKKNPHVANETIEAPVFIVGMPRAGTTFLHNLLAQDIDRFRAPMHWEVMDFVPPPRGDEQWWHPRVLAITLQHVIFRTLAPTSWQFHPLDAQNAEECLPVMAMDMSSVYFHYVFNTPSYMNWIQKKTEHDSTFKLHKQYLQLMQSNQENKKQWLLKSPWHMNHLDAIAKAYQDAIFIAPHRDPKKLVASVSSLMVRFHGVYSNDLHPENIGQSQIDHWKTIASRFHDARKSRISKERSVDIKFDDLNNDPIQIAQMIYDKLGWELTELTKQRMKRFLHESAFKKGHHLYSPDWFGVTEKDIDEAFEDYTTNYVK